MAESSAISQLRSAAQPSDLISLEEQNAPVDAVIIPEQPEVQNYPSNNTQRARALRKQIVRGRLLEEAGYRSLFARIKNQITHKNNNDMLLKNYVRVNGSGRRPCFTKAEMDKYEADFYYRACMIGSMIGLCLYVLFVIYLIMPETTNDMTVVQDWQLSRVYLPTFFAATLIVYVIKFLAVKHLNAYLILLMQIGVFALALLGSYQYRCAKEDVSSSTGPITSGGQLPLILMALVEFTFGLKDDKMREQLYAARCNDTLVRMSAVHNLGELLNVIYAVALVSNQA